MIRLGPNVPGVVGAGADGGGGDGFGFGVGVGVAGVRISVVTRYKLLLINLWVIVMLRSVAFKLHQIY